MVIIGSSYLVRVIIPLDGFYTNTSRKDKLIRFDGIVHPTNPQRVVGATKQNFLHRNTYPKVCYLRCAMYCLDEGTKNILSNGRKKDPVADNDDENEDFTSKEKEMTAMMTTNNSSKNNTEQKTN